MFIASQLKGRLKRSKMNLETEPTWWFIVKVAFGSVLIVFLTYLLGVAPGSRGTPIVLIVLGVLVVVYTAVMNRSVFGRHIYAVGGNRHAADLSGIQSRKIDFYLFVNMGVLAALAGIIFTGRLNSAGPGAGYLFELSPTAHREAETAKAHRG